MISEQILSLPIEKKIGQLFFIGLPGADIDETSAKLLEEISPGGICLFARNIREAEQTRALLDDIRSRLKVLPFLSVDQEGGLVDRLKRLLTPMPAANLLRTKQDAETLARIIAEALLTLGFNMDFAPVVDVIDETRSRPNNGLYSRGFGTSASEAAELAGQFLSTLQENGCLGCLKHFPGLGASKVDSHAELPAVELTDNELSGTDLAPYREIFSSQSPGAIMIAHACFPKSDLQEADQNGKLLPSSLSYNFVTKLLRERMGFNGLVLTDDLEMGAILKNYGIGEACVMAVLAGEDMLSICANCDAVREGYSAVAEAVKNGRISEARVDASLLRIAAAKSLLSAPIEFSATRLLELSTRIATLNQNLN
jgi:beta-N-acetylhexosaminidase